MSDADLLGAEIRQLRDIEEIKQLKSRYCRCVDTKDWAGWADLLTEDFRLEGGSGVYEGRDVVVARISQTLGEASTVHQVFTPEIELTGPETARAVWPMADWVRMTHNGTPIAFHGTGYYHEEYRRTANGWRVRSSTSERLRVDPIEGSAPIGQ